MEGRDPVRICRGLVLRQAVFFQRGSVLRAVRVCHDEALVDGVIQIDIVGIEVRWDARLAPAICCPLCLRLIAASNMVTMCLNNLSIFVTCKATVATHIVIGPVADASVVKATRNDHFSITERQALGDLSFQIDSIMVEVPVSLASVEVGRQQG